MGNGQYWICETCRQKCFDSFPATWIHIPFLTLGMGMFFNFEKVSWQDRDKYDNYKDLTFCTPDCMLKWFSQKYGVNNPSAR